MSALLLVFIPNILILFSFIVIAQIIHKNKYLAYDYIEELTLCMILLVASNLSHIVWFAFDFRFLSYMIDPLNLAIASSLAYKLWKDKK
jgi:hypothetical protein